MIDAPPGNGWLKNVGKLPKIAAGRRVQVQLRNGLVSDDGRPPPYPPGWAANDSRWSLSDKPAGDASADFDILRFRIL